MYDLGGGIIILESILLSLWSERLYIFFAYICYTAYRWLQKLLDTKPLFWLLGFFFILLLLSVLILS